MYLYVLMSRGAIYDITQPGTHGLIEGNVHGDAPAEERVRAAPGTVEILVRNDNVQRLPMRINQIQASRWGSIYL